jgi:hypothetical protein
MSPSCLHEEGKHLWAFVAHGTHRAGNTCQSWRTFPCSLCSISKWFRATCDVSVRPPRHSELAEESGLVGTPVPATTSIPATGSLEPRDDGNCLGLIHSFVGMSFMGIRKVPPTPFLGLACLPQPGACGTIPHLVAGPFMGHHLAPDFSPISTV